MFVASEVIPLLRSKVSVKIVDLFSSRKVIATIQENDSIYLFQIRKWHASCGTEIVNESINNVHNVTNKHRNVDNENENENNSNNKNENENENDDDDDNENSSSDNDIDENKSKNDNNDINNDKYRKFEIKDSKEDSTMIPTLPTNKKEIEVEVEVDIESSSELTSPLSLLSTDVNDVNDVNEFSKLSPLHSRNENENYNEIENKNRNQNNSDSYNSHGRGGDEKVINNDFSMKNNRILNRQESVDVQNYQEKKGEKVAKDKNKDDDKDSENLGPVDSSPISSSDPIKMVRSP